MIERIDLLSALVVAVSEQSYVPAVSMESGMVSDPLTSASPHPLRLSEVADYADLSIVRDATIATLAFVSSPLPSCLTFAESERFLRLALASTRVAAVITSEALAPAVPRNIGLALADEPKDSFRRLQNYLARSTDFYRQTCSSRIAEDALVHPRAYVAETDVIIGPGSIVRANASILEGSSLGRGVIVHEGASVGGVGLQADRGVRGIEDLEHAGAVEVGDGAQILANSVVARGLFRQSTVVGADARIGNLTYVSHNVHIGARTIIGHGTVINGNVIIGQGVWVGPGVTVSNGLTIGDGASVSLGSVVVKDVPPSGRVSGNFAFDHRLFLRRQGRPNA